MRIGHLWILVFMLVLRGSLPVSAALNASEPSEWKSPLAFAAIITQGPQDHNPRYTVNRCAVDLAVDYGNPILAPADGRVARIGYDPVGGWFMLIDHYGRASYHLHLSRMVRQENDVVRQGEVIACSGTGGTGPHLHFAAMADVTMRACIDMSGIDGNTRLVKGVEFKSTNRIGGDNPCQTVSPLQPAPAQYPSGSLVSSPMLVAPSNNQTLSPETEIQFEWKPVQGATQYYLEFWGGAYGTLNSGWQFSTKYVVGRVWPGTYSWRVRARNSAGMSDWSPTWSFVVQESQPNRAPNSPRLVRPGDWAVFSEETPILCAESNGDPDNDAISAYRFEIFESAQNWDSGWVTASCVSPPQLGFFNYQWRAKVRDVRGAESPWSEVWHFSIVQKPLESPRLHSPANNSTLSPTTDVWFSWNYVSGAQEYYLEFWGGPYTTLNSGWTRDVTYRVGTMWPGTYFWRVKARNDRGQESNWSPTWTFTVASPTSIPPTVTATLLPPRPTSTPTSFQGNVAPLCTRIPDGINSSNAFDGNLSTFWVDGLGHRFHLELRFPQSLPVSRVLIWDRPQNSPDNNQINEVVLRLSNGQEHRFDMNSQGARCIDVVFSSPKITSSLFIFADNASGNNGLSEVEIWVGRKTSSLTCPNQKFWP